MRIPREINILIVDDFYATTKSLIRSLKSLGFKGEIFKADQVSLAERYFTNNPLYKDLDFIISDMKIPGESDLDLLVFAKSHETIHKIPFLILSAITTKHTKLYEILVFNKDRILKMKWRFNFYFYLSCVKSVAFFK